MKKYILLALTTLLMVGCTESRKEFKAPYPGSNELAFYKTIIIDSCEYVENRHQLAHKGNCKYCAERRKQELKELVEQLKEK